MNIQDDDLRRLLLARGSRSGWVDVERMVTDALASSPAPITSKAQSILASFQDVLRGVVIVAIAVTALGVGMVLQGGGASHPTGFWQSKAPVDAEAIGSATCVAINLTPDAYATGKVTVWWWSPGDGDCRTSSSLPTEAVAALQSISLANGLGTQRTAHRVQLDLDIIGGGTERVEFVLDPLGRRLGADGLAGFAGRDSSGRTLDFTRLPGLDVTPPGGIPASTPQAAPLS